MIDDLWYKNGVFYCLSVGTCMDADGGRGDADLLANDNAFIAAQIQPALYFFSLSVQER